MEWTLELSRVLVLPLPLTALYDIGQGSGYLCPCFLISRKGGVIVTTPKHCIEMCVSSESAVTVLSPLVISNRKLVI